MFYKNEGIIKMLHCYLSVRDAIALIAFFWKPWFRS